MRLTNAVVQMPSIPPIIPVSLFFSQNFPALNGP